MLSVRGGSALSVALSQRDFNTYQARMRTVCCRMQSYVFGHAILPLQWGMGGEAAALAGIPF